MPELTRWGSTTNVVMRCVPAEGAPVGDVDRAVRRASLRIARDIAATTIDREPDSVETFSAPALDVDPGLPAVCGILQVASEGPLTDTFLYGRAVGGIDPMVLDPLELLDGALTNGAYDWPAVRNVTATYQDSSLLRTLLAAHGERLRFAGLILALGYLDTARSRSSDRRCCPLGSLAGSAPTGRSARRSRPATRTPTRC